MNHSGNCQAVMPVRGAVGSSLSGGGENSFSDGRLSRRFNFITAFLGLNAIVRGLLAFWFVDGALYALKDTVGSILIVLVFGGSLVLGHPLLGAFVAQALDPRTPSRRLRWSASLANAR
jgi:hypothetical protein